MKLATIAGTLGTIAAGAVIVASAPATPSSAAPAPAVHAARIAHKLPAWFRWGSTRDRVNGKPCIIVWAAGQNAAEICQAARWPGVSS
jgi:hypothetical protein